MAAQLEAGKHPPQKQGHTTFEQDKTGPVSGQPNETLNLPRQGQQADHVALVVVSIQLHRHGQTQIGNERERVSRVDGQRCEHRENRAHEALFQPGLLLRGQVRRLDHGHVLFAQLVDQRTPDPLLFAHQRPRPGIDLSELLTGA